MVDFKKLLALQSDPVARGQADERRRLDGEARVAKDVARIAACVAALDAIDALQGVAMNSYDIDFFASMRSRAARFGVSGQSGEPLLDLTDNQSKYFDAVVSRYTGKSIDGHGVIALAPADDASNSPSSLDEEVGHGLS